jgi:opacity protein-like surface antigen
MSGLILGGGAGFAFSLAILKGAEYAYIDGGLVEFFNISGDLSN